ncbi:MAG: hypothetical protein BA861_03145 [Desulfobacterales bacterium S3730MH5]|nr:MAG: hypothetical protein BA861_03145 [Desulfobacterales bacterium S3730MH5]
MNFGVDFILCNILNTMICKESCVAYILPGKKMGKNVIWSSVATRHLMAIQQAFHAITDQNERLERSFYE